MKAYVWQNYICHVICKMATQFIHFTPLVQNLVQKENENEIILFTFANIVLIYKVHTILTLYKLRSEDENV